MMLTINRWRVDTSIHIPAVLPSLFAPLNRASKLMLRSAHAMRHARSSIYSSSCKAYTLRYNWLSLYTIYLITNINMKSVSIIAAAAVMLASSANAASNDPRECEGKIHHLFIDCTAFWAVLPANVCHSHPFISSTRQNKITWNNNINNISK